jgi:hypothetical protein
LIGIGISGLGSPARQLELWDKNAQKARKLQQALDKLEEKYGEDVIKRGKVYKQAKEK